jgi:outer membrane protein assembly factor BamE (lipoprotein component of BamABCDE complex)
MKRLICVLLPIALAVSGCTSTGVQVDENALTSFQKGKTTVNEVIARLGQPTSNILLNTGQRIIGYTYIQAQARPESFIPIIGPLVGGADSHFSNVSLTFDQNGILQSFSSTQSQFGSAHGGAPRRAGASARTQSLTSARSPSRSLPPGC